MKTKSGPNSSEYKSFVQMREELTNNKEVIVLGIFEKDRQSKHDTQSKFFKASDKLRETVIFRHVFTDSVPNVYDLDILRNLKDMSLPNVLLIRPKHLRNKFETNYVVYAFGEIRDFIKFNYHGLVGLRTHFNTADFKLPIVIIYYEVNYVNNTKKTNYVRNRILKVAKNYRDLKFAISNVHDFSNDLKGFGFKSLEEALNLMPIITARDKNDNKFVSNDQFSDKSLTKFVNDFKNWKLKTFVLSEELPENNENSDVKVAVANNIEELVFNSDKETLIVFYSPDCKQLEPLLEKLGKAFKNEPKVQIVKFNCMSNDVPKKFDVRRYPTIYWYNRNKEPLIYNESLQFFDFIKFIAKHSSEELNGFDRNANVKEIKDEL